MASSSLAEYESRAALAEKQIEVLTARMDELEKALSGKGGGKGLTDYKVQVLNRLRDIRETMGAEKREADKILAERNQLKEQNEKLKVENEKLKYRVHILLKSLEEAEKK